MITNWRGFPLTTDIKKSLFTYLYFYFLNGIKNKVSVLLIISFNFEFYLSKYIYRV